MFSDRSESVAPAFGQARNRVPSCWGQVIALVSARLQQQGIPPPPVVRGEVKLKLGTSGSALIDHDDSIHGGDRASQGLRGIAAGKGVCPEPVYFRYPLCCVPEGCLPALTGDVAELVIWLAPRTTLVGLELWGLANVSQQGPSTAMPHEYWTDCR